MTEAMTKTAAVCASLTERPISRDFTNPRSPGLDPVQFKRCTPTTEDTKF